MNTIILIARICMGSIPSIIICLFAFIWQASLIINLGIVNCLSLIHLSIAHSWSWVHDWQAKSIHRLCALIIALQLVGVSSMDLYEVGTLRLEYYLMIFISCSGYHCTTQCCHQKWDPFLLSFRKFT